MSETTLEPCGRPNKQSTMPPRMAMDTSDDDEFVAFVIGRDTEIESLHTFCKPPGMRILHVREIPSRDDKKLVITRMRRRLSNRACASLVRFHCIRTAHRDAINALPSAKRKQYDRRGSARVAVNHFIMTKIKGVINPSLNSFRIGQNWCGQVIEGDKDSEPFIRISGATMISPAAAQGLADAVAWANQAKIVVRGVKSHDLSKEILEGMSRIRL